MAHIEIREFKRDEWDLYRSLRLSSLRDSPDSFGSTNEIEFEILTTLSII